MMEVLFISNLIAVAYFMTLWLKTNKLWHLLACGIFVSLASISRFEGLILIPITGLIVFIQFLKISKNYRKIEASVILFFILAIVGLLLVMGYGLVYGGNPFSFAGGGWWIRGIIEEEKPAQGNIFLSLQYILYASFYMISKSLVFISLASSILLLFISNKRFQHFSVLLILLSPLIFIIVSLFNGSVPMHIMELSPENKFLNERYGLTWIAFVAFVPVLLISFLMQKTNKIKSFSFVNKFLGNIFIIILISLSIYNIYYVTSVNKFNTIILNKSFVDEKQNKVIAKEFFQKYDNGKILAIRVNNDPLLIEAGVPLENYVYEGNYIFYDQVLGEPWFFARWVIMYNTEDTTDIWAKLKEPISVKWADSKLFHKYYVLAVENDKKKIYKINENALEKLAKEQRYDFSKMPSVNPEITKWDPETIYEEMGTFGSSEIIPEFSKSEVKEELLNLYDSEMKTKYQEGFYTDKDKIGNSETQSYLLLQSYLADDKETFEKVWQWTKKSTQRKEDNLFAWKFKVNEQKAEIIDANPATDADEDIAFALLKAGEKWSKLEYIDEAKLIIKDIWEIETAEFNGKRYVVAGNWANTEKNLVVNPSYFSPLAYRLFAKYDIEHNWNSLISDNYDLLEKATEFNLRNGLGVFLPPNWIALDKGTGDVLHFGDNRNSLGYSYDAFRVFWRVAMDYEIYGSDQAKQYLEKIEVFQNEWEENEQIYSLYELDKENTYRRSTATMAGPLSVFVSTDQAVAEEVVKKYYLESGKIAFPENSSFYDRHWYWMGLALWSELEF